MEQKDQVAKVDALLSRFLFKLYQLFRQTKSAVARRRFGGGCRVFRHHAKLGAKYSDRLLGPQAAQSRCEAGQMQGQKRGYSAILTSLGKGFALEIPWYSMSQRHSPR